MESMRKRNWLGAICAMLAALLRAFPLPMPLCALPAALCCLLFSLVGFGPLVDGLYPVLGALCAGLLLLLCAPGYPAKGAQSSSPSAR